MQPVYAHIVRQPIYNVWKEVCGYELLCQNAAENPTAREEDKESAVQRVLSDAITVFGLPHLTNKFPAFVSFTEDMIQKDFALLADPKDIILQLHEDVIPKTYKKLLELYEAGYPLALQGYTGKTHIRESIFLFQMIKVDFDNIRLLRQETIQKPDPDFPILVNHIKTQQDFERAKKMGATLFQGMYFEEPQVVSRRIPTLSTTSYSRLMGELQKPVIDFSSCSKIIQSDPALTYLFIRQIQTANYYRGNEIAEIKRGIVMMGTKELRRWLFLVLMRQNSVLHSDELARQAYLRGRFIEQLMEHANHAPPSEEGFLLGLFSLLDKILGANMTELLKDIQLKQPLKEALLGQAQNTYAAFLNYVIQYEQGNIIPYAIELQISTRDIPSLYMQCVAETDEEFQNLTNCTVPES